MTYTLPMKKLVFPMVMCESHHFKDMEALAYEPETYNTFSILYKRTPDRIQNFTLYMYQIIMSIQYKIWFS